MRLQHLLLLMALAGTGALAWLWWDRVLPEPMTEAEALCTHYITTGQIIRARGCI